MIFRKIIVKDIKSVFKNFEAMIRKASWFDDNWDIYNRGDYFQLYKSNWHNHNQGGVHFETYIEGKQIKEKEFPVCIHAEEDCPNQQGFIKRVLEMEGDRIRSWKGYKVSGSTYSICQRNLPLNFKNIEQRLFEEFNRMRQLSSSIDKILAEC